MFNVVICKAAAWHEDGTYSISNGGMASFSMAIPGTFGLVAMFEIEAKNLPKTEFAFSAILSMAGKTLNTIDGTAKAGASGFRAVIPLTTPIDLPGKLRIEIRVDKLTSISELDLIPSGVSVN